MGALRVAVSALALTSSLGSHAVAETLDEAMAAAYMTSPKLEAQRAKLRGTDEGVAQALSNYRPTVSMSGAYGAGAYESNQATGTNRFQHRNPRSYSVDVSQPVFRGFRTLAQTSGAENKVMADRARLVAAEQGVLLDAVKAYMDVVRDQAVVDLNINNEQVLKRQLEATTDRFEVGEITRTDVHQAEARLAKATADRIKAAGDLEASRARYENVMGGKPAKLDPPPLPEGLPAGKDEAMDLASAQHPEVVAALYDERTSRDTVDQVRGELLPTVSVSGSAGRSFDSGGEDSRTTDYSGKVTLSVPLYQSGSVYSRLRQAKQTVSQGRRTMDQARRDSIESASRAWETLETAKARILSYETQIRAAEVALDGVEREAAVGSRTVLDVLDAEQELLDGKVAWVRAERDAVVAAYELIAAVGGLTTEAIALPVERYDPNRHYDEVRGKWFGGTASGEVEDENSPE